MTSLPLYHGTYPKGMKQQNIWTKTLNWQDIFQVNIASKNLNTEILCYSDIGAYDSYKEQMLQVLIEYQNAYGTRLQEIRIIGCL